MVAASALVVLAAPLFLSPPSGTARATARRVDTRAKLLVVVALGIVACGTTQKQQLIETTASAMGPEERASTFEATARVLDENPEYIDEFYRVVRKHPKTMSRFFARATPDLKSEPVAETQAKLIVEKPASLEAVLKATIDAMVEKPKARAVLAKVMAAKATTVADMVTDDPTAMIATMNATVAAVEGKPAAQPPFFTAMKASAPRVAAILAKDPSTLAVLTQELLKVWAKDKPSLHKLLEKAGALD